MTWVPGRRRPRYATVFRLMIAGAILFSAIFSSATAGTSATTLALSSSTPTAGAVVTLTATVTDVSTSTAVKPGTVNFYDNYNAATLATFLGSAQLTSVGQAVFRVRPVTGTHSYSARFVGTTTESGSISPGSSLVASAVP
jgi:hypothetical protein